MIPSQLVPYTNHLWQSTLFAGVACLLTLSLKKNRAHVRYWLWLMASVKFLIPLSIFVAAGGLLARHTAVAARPYTIGPVAALFSVFEPAGEPFAAEMPPSPAPQPSYASVVAWVLLVVWAVGCVMLVRRWIIDWRRMRVSVRKASPLELLIGIPVMSSAAFGEPGVFGILRPVLLLPHGIADHLTPQEMDAIVAHELCHVRRRDNLTAAIHMAVQAVFWFHPLVWWLGARLVEERERACDEEVLRAGGDPHTYAEGILKICELYLASPLACAAGVTGGDLKRRIEAIMGNRVTRRLNYAKRAILAVTAIGAVAAPMAIGLLHAAAPQHQAVPAPKLEVVSVKPCNEADMRPGARSGPTSVSGKTLLLDCQVVHSFIARAFVDYANGEYQGAGAIRCLPVEGLPAWTNSERYTIEAKAEGAVSRLTAFGPMLQKILEDRFQLKMHRETREVPIYEMTAAKGGIKFAESVEGSCEPRDLTKDQQALPKRVPGQKPFCGQSAVKLKGAIHTVDLLSVTMTEFSHWLIPWSDRLIVDKTGIAAKFDIHLEYTSEENADAPDAGPSMFEEVARLGLKLTPAKGPGEFLVVDHVERPSAN
jgi:bla regulator protein blaR1